MGVTWEERLVADIELACRRHREPGVFGPGIPIVDGRWAYCASNANADHEWVEIRPTSLDEVKAATSVEQLQKR